MVLFPFLLALSLVPQGATAQGLNSSRDAFVDVVGPRNPVEDWSVPMKTQVPIYPVVGEGVVVYGRSFDWLSPTGTVLEAVELATGKLLWSTDLPAGGGNWDVPVAIRDGKVFAANLAQVGTFARLHALDLATGARLWTSEHGIGTSYQTSPVFLPGGDLILNGRFVPGKGFRLLRIDHTDGTSVWHLPAGFGTLDSLAGGAVHAGRFYYVRALGGTHDVVRADPDTGLPMYSSPPVGDGQTSVGGANLMVSSNGMVFFPWGGNYPNDGAELIAYDDSGSALTERWRFPIKTGMFLSGGAIGPDGSVYHFSPDNEIVRLDGDSGIELNRSPAFGFELLHGRMAIDRLGKLYVVAGTTGAVPQELHVFFKDLTRVFAKQIGISPTVGPILGSDGRLIVSTNNEVVKAYIESVDTGFEALCETPASVVGRNGSGINRACLVAVGGPRIGEVWTVFVDASSHVGVVGVGVLIASQPSSGIFLRSGELLIDPTSALLAKVSAPSTGGVARLPINVPPEASLCGMTASAQAYLVGGGAELCNAMDLVFGF